MGIRGGWWGLGGGWLVGCQACLFICEVARVTGIVRLEWVQCFQSKGRGITGNMTWHSCWTRPLSPPLHRPLHRLHLQKTFPPAEQPYHTPCSLSDIIITIKWGNTDIWPLSIWEEGVVRGSQAGIRGMGGFRRWKISCSNCANSQHGYSGAASV